LWYSGLHPRGGSTMVRSDPRAGKYAQVRDLPCERPEGRVGLSLRIKLLAAFGIMLAMTVVVGIIGVSEAGHINSGAADLYDDAVVGPGEVATLSQASQQMRAAVLAHILATDAGRKTALEADIAKLDRDIDTTLERLRSSDPDERQRAALALFTQSWD